MSRAMFLMFCLLIGLFVSGCSQQDDLSLATRVDAAPIQPVPVPGSATVSQPEPSPSLTTLPPDERQRAEELLELSAAYARAFSPRVVGLQESISRTVQNQFANQVLTDRRSIEIRRGDTRWRPSGPFMSCFHGKDGPGSYAGDEYLESQNRKLSKQLEDLVTRYETTLQEEAWLRLSVNDQALIVKHDLISQTIRETALENSQAIMRHLKKLPEEPAQEQPLDQWSVVQITGTPFEVAFPTPPNITQADGTTTYTATHAGRTFIVEVTSKVDVPENLQPNEVLRTLAENDVSVQEQQGRSGAVRTSMLGELPATERCSFYRIGVREKASYCRYALLNGNLLTVQVHDARADGDPGSLHFLESFRRRRSSDE